MAGLSWTALDAVALLLTSDNIFSCFIEPKPVKLKSSLAEVLAPYKVSECFLIKPSLNSPYQSKECFKDKI